MRRLLGGAAWFGAAMALLLGCAQTRPTGAVAYPEACQAFELSQRRCDFIVAWARSEVASSGDAVQIQFVPDTGCRTDNGEICIRSAVVPLWVRFVFPGGTVQDRPIVCGVGSQYSLLCTDTPEIRISSATMNGYRDIPEGATPVPGVEPDVQALAVPLRVARREIAIDHVGRYAVELGRAGLPNGILREASFGLSEARPAFVQMTEDGLWLSIESEQPDRPAFLNIYEHGWWPGVEPVRAVLRFEVVAFEPGASLELLDVLVR